MATYKTKEGHYEGTIEAPSGRHFKITKSASTSKKEVAKKMGKRAEKNIQELSNRQHAEYFKKQKDPTNKYNPHYNSQD